jgi:hypothetical protein
VRKTGAQQQPCGTLCDAFSPILAKYTPKYDVLRGKKLNFVPKSTFQPLKT